MGPFIRGVNLVYLEWFSKVSTCFDLMKSHTLEVVPFWIKFKFMEMCIPALKISSDSIHVSTHFIMSGLHFVVFNIFD